MNKKIKIVICILILMFLYGCSNVADTKGNNTPSVTPVIKTEISNTPTTKVTTTPTIKATPTPTVPVVSVQEIEIEGEFMKGVDLSSVISMEKSGVIYYDTEGNPGDIFQIFKDAGINYVRVRVWNDPYISAATEESMKTPENSYGGGVCDVNYAVQIAERCKAVGLSLYVDFHYSDFWSDPGRSYVPKAWKDMSIDEKAVALSEFTTESLEKIAATGVHIGIVSIGNETTSWMAGENGITKIAVLMKSGAEAVRAFDKDILIAVHFTNPEKHNYVSAYAAKLDSAGVDYDIFASSYYPIWHGTLSNLKTKLEAVTKKYGKQTLIAEYSYDHEGKADAIMKATFGEFNEEGQMNAIKVINEAAAGIEGCLGTFYWEPAWLLTAPEYWASEGAGWISHNGWEYDVANKNIKNAQGSACASGALFDEKGYPLLAIKEKVFK